MNEHWQYTLRCKKCQEETDYLYRSRTSMSEEVFEFRMKEMGESILQAPCDKCKKYTVHELICWDVEENDDLYDKKES